MRKVIKTTLWNSLQPQPIHLWIAVNNSFFISKLFVWHSSGKVVKMTLERVMWYMEGKNSRKPLENLRGPQDCKHWPMRITKRNVNKFDLLVIKYYTLYFVLLITERYLDISQFFFQTSFPGMPNHAQHISCESTVS